MTKCATHLGSKTIYSVLTYSPQITILYARRALITVEDTWTCFALIDDLNFNPSPE